MPRFRRAKSTPARATFEKLGRGAHSTVYELDQARVLKTPNDEHTSWMLKQEHAALQMLRKDIFHCDSTQKSEGEDSDAACCSRFATASLYGRNIVLDPRGLDLEKAAGAPWIRPASGRGSSPTERLRCGQRSLPLPWLDLKQVLGDVVAAVRCLHRKSLFHGDIKPANVIVYCTQDRSRLPHRPFAAILSDIEQLHTAAGNHEQPMDKVPFTMSYASKSRAFLGLGRPLSEDTLATLLTLLRALQIWKRAFSETRRPLPSDFLKLEAFLVPLVELRPGHLDPACLRSVHRWMRDGVGEMQCVFLQGRDDESQAFTSATKETMTPKKKFSCGQAVSRVPLSSQASERLLLEKWPILAPLFRPDPAGCTACRSKGVELAGRCVKDTSFDFNNCKYALLPPQLPPGDPASSEAYRELCDVWYRARRDPTWQRDVMRKLEGQQRT